jgi:hypothetical protein
MRRYTQACAIGIVVALWIGFPAAQNTQVPPAVASLIQKANRDGSVRVIVGVRATFTPEGRLDQSQAALQRDAIALAQADVIDRLTGPIDAVRRFSSIPFFAARVSAATLTQLSAMPEVVSIQEDVAEPPLLA